ncbi:hypothetical protein ABT116_35255 [Streptomyces sp. NPDC002130]|uniref:hypothetical protein n=1 Tax=Streptomyces sp. NPDC002130 TaxID=3155568 RepID=UPI00332F99E5
MARAELIDEQGERRPAERGASPQVQEAPDVVVPVEGPTVHVRGVGLGTRRQ